jgi:YidC/Oxa1 family membrane protein insertase
MERRVVLFVVLAFLILFGHFALMSRLRPPRPQPPKVAQEPLVKEGPEAEKASPQGQPEKPPQPPEQSKPAKQPPAEEPKIEVPELAEQAPALPDRWVTLGSADPADPFRMLVTLTSRGAAVARIELSSPRCHDLEDRSGYLGHLVMDERVEGNGCLVQVVGAGTPAAKAGLRPDDLIQAVDGTKITGADALRVALAARKPKQTVELTVDRQGREFTLQATLSRRPLEIIKPENMEATLGQRSREILKLEEADPLSMLLSLQQLDQWKLKPEDETVAVGKELGGVNLWTANWELLSADQREAKFRRVLSQSGLELVKTFRLASVPEENLKDETYPAYHLELEIEIRNAADQQHTVAYQLDGPNGLPTEGAWYANKVSRAGGAAGLRDLVVCFGRNTPDMVNCPSIADNKVDKPWENEPLTYIGIDAQYFSVVMVPQKENSADTWFARCQPLRVGKVDPQRKNLTNTSCRLISKPRELAPGGVLKHRFVVFAGPKKPDLLAQADYRLDKLVYYGWPIFAWVAVPLTQLLHVLYACVYNYGLAIILLTVLVRGCMFPMSRKQALNAQKMQELQPEIKRIQEKYKKDMEGRAKAQQELFRKHKYNPLSGCLVIFIQLPIFMGLYRALMVDVELRQAPLISEAIFWCSNLAAPDMLYDWSWFMPEWVSRGTGILGLGPYFNLLPILTIVLFLWQQKMFMPPAADEQAAMQQKIMQYMMVFMGVLFFKVASGLCIYFIASSLWGLAERKLLPKTSPAPSARPQSRAEAKAQAALQAKTAPPQIAGNRDGAAAGKKHKFRGKR